MNVKEVGSEKMVTGITTCDGLSHSADLVIVACESTLRTSSTLLTAFVGGGWTAGVIPEAHRAVETTGGTVMFIDVPKDRPDLWEKFHPDNFPVWSYRRGEGDE